MRDLVIQMETFGEELSEPGFYLHAFLFSHGCRIGQDGQIFEAELLEVQGSDLGEWLALTAAVQGQVVFLEYFTVVVLVQKIFWQAQVFLRDKLYLLAERHPLYLFFNC